MQNAKLERHMARSHALLHEISAYIYIYIYIISAYIYIDNFSFITSNHSSTWVSKNFLTGLYHTYKISIDFLYFFFFLKYIAIVFILIRI